MSKPAKQPSPLTAAAGIVGAVGGWTLSQYCGASIWIPGAAILLLLLLFTKTPIRPKYFAGVIAVTAAHIIWFVVAGAVTGDWSATILDIIVLTIGIVWVWARPGVIAALFVAVVQGASLAVNAYAISSVPFGSAAHRALTTHCVLRIIAIVCLVIGYIRFRRERSAPPPVPSVAAL
jgi:hypothetical protein